MQSNSHFSIAVHICLALAYKEQQGVDLASSAELAKGVNTSPAFVRRIVSYLVKSGLVVSKPGKAGGVSLARKASSIAVADIYAACREHTPLLDLHQQPVNTQCSVSCAAKGLMEELRRDVEGAAIAVMQRKSVADLLARI